MNVKGSVVNVSKRWHSLATIISASKGVWFVICSFSSNIAGLVGCFSETISRCKLIREKGKVIFKVCDGLDDCGDYSDETNSNCSIMKRVGETMQCKVYTRGETTKCILFVCSWLSRIRSTN